MVISFSSSATQKWDKTTNNRGASVLRHTYQQTFKPCIRWAYNCGPPWHASLFTAPPAHSSVGSLHDTAVVQERRKCPSFRQHPALRACLEKPLAGAGFFLGGGGGGGTWLRDGLQRNGSLDPQRGNGGSKSHFNIAGTCLQRAAGLPLKLSHHGLSNKNTSPGSLLRGAIGIGVITIGLQSVR